MIVSNLPLLRVQKEKRDGRKLPVRVIAEEARVSPGAVQRLMSDDFERVDTATLDAMCSYFECGLGDLLEYQKGEAK